MKPGNRIERRVFSTILQRLASVFVMPASVASSVPATPVLCPSQCTGGCSQGYQSGKSLPLEGRTVQPVPVREVSGKPCLSWLFPPPPLHHLRPEKLHCQGSVP